MKTIIDVPCTVTGTVPCTPSHRTYLHWRPILTLSASWKRNLVGSSWHSSHQSSQPAWQTQLKLLYYIIMYLLTRLSLRLLSLVSNSSKYSLCFINHVLPHSYFSFFASALSISSLCWNKLQTNEIIFFVVNFIFYYSSKHWQFDLYVLSGWWW